jgi:membrane protein involved in colicin uptake
MDSHGSYPIDSVVVVQTLGKNWPRFTRQDTHHKRKESQHPEEHEKELLADTYEHEQDNEQQKKEVREGATKDHQGGFEITV